MNSYGDIIAELGELLEILDELELAFPAIRIAEAIEILTEGEHEE